MNRALLILGLAALEVCWIYPWSLLVGLWLDGTTTSGLLSPLTMLALLLLASGVTYVGVRRLRTRRQGQAALVAVGVLAALVAVRADHYPDGGLFGWLPRLAEALAVLFGHPTVAALAVLFSLLLWRRGAQLGSDTPAFPDVEAAFRWSIGALIGFAVLLALAVRPSQQPAIEARATPFVVGAFFVSLLTLALARLDSMRTRSRALGLNTQWLGVLIAVAGLLVLGSLAVAQVLSFDLLLVATRPLFDLLGQVLLLLLYVIVIPLAFVIEWLVYWLLQFISPGSNNQPPQAPEPADIEGFLRRLGQAIPPDVLGALKVVGAVLLLTFALLLVARTVARWRPRLGEAEVTHEERESVYQRGSLRQALLAWLWRLFRKQAPPTVEANPLTMPTESAVPASVSNVRELYRRLLALGALKGATRPMSSTPYEHEPALHAALHAAPEIAELTDAYVEVRYAEIEPSEAELQELELTLNRVAQPEEAGPGLARDLTSST